MVFYRKYRPQKITELDSGFIRGQLEAILSSSQVPHAFLFSGPRGLGKTSAARIVAKSVNCLEKTKGEPCNRCKLCLDIAAGTSLDILEIDGASHRGIDEIRDLREKIKLVPSFARLKVYIIDEAHMLTPEAFNALLKTLEEPPAHALFILCTTQGEKLPPTIISRCFRLDFPKAKGEEILRSLKRVCQGEKLEVEEGILLEIAQRVDGSFRDGVKILEQASLGGQKISGEKVREILGQQSFLKPEKLLKLLAERKTPEAILEIDKVVKAGGNLPVYTEQILETLRKALLVKVGVEEKEASLGFEKIEEIQCLISLFSQAWGELKTAVIPQLPLEMVVVAWCEQAPGALSSGVGSDPLSGVCDTLNRAPVGEILEVWPQILSAVKPHNHTLAGVLRGCRPKSFNGKILTIEAFYKFHQERLEQAQAVLEKVVGEVLGEAVKVKCVFAKKEVKANV